VTSACIDEIAHGGVNAAMRAILHRSNHSPYDDVKTLPPIAARGMKRP
jgi:hypothetical protein